MRRMLVSFAAMIGCAVSTWAADPAAPPVCGDSRHYVLLFGGQASWRPNTAHTWATFVRTSRNPSGITLVEQFTISWLPDQGPVRPFKLRPSPGRNHDLFETLDRMSGSSSPRLSLWGPWEITPDWYGEAAQHKAVLDGGAVQYKVIYRPRRDDLAHCVHAVTKTDPTLSTAAGPIVWFGERVTRRVANAMAESGLLVNPHIMHDWLIQALGIERYPLMQQRLYGPVLRIVR